MHKNYKDLSFWRYIMRAVGCEIWGIILKLNHSKRLNLLSQFKYDLYTDSNFGTEQSVPVWNASVSYALLKNRNLRIQLTGFDLLNRNVGITRTSSDNFFEEMQQEVLGNYYKLHFTYDFKGFWSGNQENEFRFSWQNDSKLQGMQRIWNLMRSNCYAVLGLPSELWSCNLKIYYYEKFTSFYRFAGHDTLC